MQKLANIVVVAVVLGVPSVKSAHAAGGAPASIQRLTERADAVVVARLAGGFASPTDASFSLEVEEAFKGSVEPGQVISVSWAPEPPSAAGPVGGAEVPADTGLFFLKARSSPAGWQLLPAAHGKIRSLRGAYYPVPKAGERTVPEGDQPDEKALLLLLRSFEAGSMRPDSPLVSWADELRVAGERPAVRRAIDRLASSPNEHLKSLAVSARIARGDLNALAAVAAGTGPQAEAVVNDALRYRFVSDDPKAASLLVRIVTDDGRELELRRSAAAALTRLRSMTALEAFARLLEEKDPYLQAAGIGGLSRFANNISSETHHPEPGAWKFRTDATMAHAAIDPRQIATKPAVYVSFWQDWWDQNRANIAGSR